jgi:hypothetical protein
MNDIHAPSRHQKSEGESQSDRTIRDHEHVLTACMRVSISASAIDTNKYVPILQQRRSQQKKPIKKKKKRQQRQQQQEVEEEGVKPFLPPMMKVIDQSNEELRTKRPTKEVSSMRLSPVPARLSEEVFRTDFEPSIFPSLTQATELQTASEAKKKPVKKKPEDEYVIKIKPKSSSNRPPKTNPYIGLNPFHPLTLLNFSPIAHLQPKKVSHSSAPKNWNDNFVVSNSMSSSSKTANTSPSPNQIQQSISLSPQRRSERERIPIPVPVLTSPRNKTSTPSLIATNPAPKKRSSKAKESVPSPSSPPPSLSLMSSPLKSQPQTQELPSQPSLDETLLRIRDELQFLETQLDVKKEVFDSVSPLISLIE